jgi:hypothetical protein
MSETLLNEIRATKPVAPQALRERVRALAAEEPAREPFLARLRPRRLVLAAPVTLVVALLAAGVIGLTRGDVTGGDEQAASSAASTVATLEAGAPQREIQQGLRALPAPPTAADSAAGVAPVPGQRQRYEAELRLRVDDLDALSDATKRAQRIAADHGGSVASLQYDAPEAGLGAAQLTLRIPTARVESAMAQLSQLGTIVGQRFGIDDLERQATSLERQIEQTQRRIAQILTQLESPNLSDADRAVLQSRLSASRQKLTALRESLGATNAEARTATVFLSLTTEQIEPGAVGGSRLDDVENVLAWEAIALLYVLVVAGPFVLLGLLVWLAVRLRRRQVETRLLEQN